MVDEHMQNESQAVNGQAEPRVKLGVEDLSISYAGQSALRNVSFDIRENEIFGIIGPANAGKTSFLKAVNRMDVFNPEMKIDGRIVMEGTDVGKIGLG